MGPVKPQCVATELLFGRDGGICGQRTFGHVEIILMPFSAPKSDWDRAFSLGFAGLAAATHQVEEVHIGLGGLHIFEHQLHRLDLIHVVHELAQDAGFLQYFGWK